MTRQGRSSAGGNTGGSAVDNTMPTRRQRDGTGGEAAVAFPERDVHGPVVASGLGEFARAVEWIDDPHAVGVEAAPVVGRLLRQHPVLGMLGGEQLEQVTVRECVAGIAERPGRTGVVVAQREQELARALCVPGGVGMVIHVGSSVWTTAYAGPNPGPSTSRFPDVPGVSSTTVPPRKAQMSRMSR